MAARISRLQFTVPSKPACTPCSMWLASAQCCFMTVTAEAGLPRIWQVVKEEGCYPNGRVHVDVLPTEVYGQGCHRDFSLRRIDSVMGKKELKDHVDKELLKVRGWGRMEGGTHHEMRHVGCRKWGTPVDTNHPPHRVVAWV